VSEKGKEVTGAPSEQCTLKRRVPDSTKDGVAYPRGEKKGWGDVKKILFSGGAAGTLMRVRSKRKKRESAHLPQMRKCRCKLGKVKTRDSRKKEVRGTKPIVDWAGGESRRDRHKGVGKVKYRKCGL